MNVDEHRSHQHSKPQMKADEHGSTEMDKYTGFMALPYRDLLTYCQSQNAWVRETIEALVRLESPSHDKVAVDRCGNELEQRLTVLGASVEPPARHTRRSPAGSLDR